MPDEDQAARGLGALILPAVITCAVALSGAALKFAWDAHADLAVIHASETTTTANLVSRAEIAQLHDEIDGLRAELTRAKARSAVDRKNLWVYGNWLRDRLLTVFWELKLKPPEQGPAFVSDDQ